MPLYLGCETEMSSLNANRVISVSFEIISFRKLREVFSSQKKKKKEKSCLMQEIFCSLVGHLGCPV